MFLGQPNGRRGGRRGQHDLDTGLAQQIHRPSQPAKIKFAFLRFAQAPREFAHADHVDARLLHQFGVMFPGGFGLIGGAAIRIDPLLRIIIDAEIHMWSFRVRPLLHSKNFQAVSQRKTVGLKIKILSMIEHEHKWRAALKTGVNSCSLLRMRILLALTLGGCLLSITLHAADPLLVYIGTYSSPRSKGIYLARFDTQTGKLTQPELAAETRSPSFLAIHPNRRYLYAVGEIDTFEGKKGGAVQRVRTRARHR